MSQGPRRHLRLENVDGVTVVSFVESKIVTEENIQEVGDQLYSLVEDEGHKNLLLNFGNVQYLSSAALGKLINLKTKSGRGQRQAEALLHPPRPARGLPHHPARPGLRDLRRRAGGPRQVLIESRRARPTHATRRQSLRSPPPPEPPRVLPVMQEAERGQGERPVREKPAISQPVPSACAAVSWQEPA